MATKPTKHTEWASNNSNPVANIIEPSAPKKEEGWVSGGEKPPYQTFNWIQKLQDEWNKWFEQETDRKVANTEALTLPITSYTNITGLSVNSANEKAFKLKSYVEAERPEAVFDILATQKHTGFNGDTNVCAVLNDGFLLGSNAGNFDEMYYSKHLIKLFKNGEVDDDFISNVADFNSSGPNAIAQQADGKILVGGEFTAYNGNTRNRLIRLNEDGTEDTAFYTALGTAFNGPVETIYVQSDGKILVGGNFFGASGFDGKTRNGLIRLNSDGTEDSAFHAAHGGFLATFPDSPSVYGLDIDSSGNIYVAGLFHTVDSVLGRNHIAKLDSTGSVITSFYTNTGTAFNSPCYCIALIDNDTKLSVGGEFTQFNGVNYSRHVILDIDGTINTDFVANYSGGFNSIIFTNAKIDNNNFLVGGLQTLFNGSPLNGLYITSMNNDGTSADSLYFIGADSTVKDMVVDGEQILFVGSFDNLNTIYSKKYGFFKKTAKESKQISFSGYWDTFKNKWLMKKSNYYEERNFSLLPWDQTGLSATPSQVTAFLTRDGNKIKIRFILTAEPTAVSTWCSFRISANSLPYKPREDINGRKFVNGTSNPMGLSAGNIGYIESDGNSGFIRFNFYSRSNTFDTWMYEMEYETDDLPRDDKLLYDISITEIGQLQINLKDGYFGATSTANLRYELEKF